MEITGIRCVAFILSKLRPVPGTQEAKPDSENGKVDLEFSKDVISSISRTEAERLLPSGSDAERKEKEMEITKRMVRSCCFLQVLSSLANLKD